MNIMKIITMGMTFYNLNKGLAGRGKEIMGEGVDILQSISQALKDNKITNAEKEVIVGEVEQFCSATIEAIEKITIPESD